MLLAASKSGARLLTLCLLARLFGRLLGMLGDHTPCTRDHTNTDTECVYQNPAPHGRPCIGGKQGASVAFSGYNSLRQCAGAPQHQFTASGLALITCNIDRAFLTLGPGGVGQSRKCCLQMNDFVYMLSYVEMNIFLSTAKSTLS